MIVRVSYSRALLTIMMLISICVSGAVLWTSPSEAATFRGTVVDAETREPLEGAVVVVVWNRYRVFDWSRAAILDEVVEQVTRPDGSFAVDISPGLPPARLARRTVTVYKPGYRPEGQTTGNGMAPLFPEPVIPLTKVRTLAEARRYRDGSDIGVDVCMDSENPWCVKQEQVPRLLQLIALQKKVFDPYPAGLFQAEAETPSDGLGTRMVNTARASDVGDARGWTPLIQAADRGDAEMVQGLLASGAAVDAKTPRGLTALGLATLRRHTDIVRQLLAAGADVNVRDGAGDTPILIASRFELVLRVGRPAFPVGTAVLPAGAGSFAASAVAVGGGRVWETVRDKEPELVALLLAAGADPNSRDRDGLTPLMYAAGQGRLELVQVLLAGGADPELSTPSGITAWQLATGEEVIRLLREAGRDRE